jgi:Tol biopolymer transport system component
MALRKRVFFGVITLLLVACFSKLKAQKTWAKTGSFTTFADVGNPAIKGKASFSEPDQKYKVTGSGENIWLGKDSFSFLSKNMKGDFIVQTQFQYLGQGHDLHRKTGIMFRNSVSEGSAMVACTVHGDGLASLQYRRTEGADVEEIQFKINGPDVLQLEKKGKVYTMSVAHFGEVYQSKTIDDLDLGEELMAGLFVCAHTGEVAETVEFWNTRVLNTAPDDLVQYQEYLGSLLEVMDVETGHRSVLAQDSGSWQAPNWTPDGKTLIYNASGLLYNFDLKSRQSTVLNTDFATNNNNDHVLTFDGRQMGISHHPAETNGQSVVYTLPVTGGVPKRITEKSPSYLHGWSPDNRFLIYTGGRNGDYDIYKIPADGGEEIQLTTAKGLDDGSEYSPDGRYIYFCSTRTGTMQVWRMEPDGSNQVQLTFDKLNDWFPHVSPDNKWLVFVSFPEEVPADEHPFYQRVYIRLMPIEGGEPKVIGYLYGGQGSINVPSWSPDSKKIAFVSNGYFGD